jgi:DNA mismatch endonuclease, patch repair protein
MSRIRSRNTGPELALRSLLRRLGLRYRSHAANLPGSPDVVLPGFQIAIFVHGCFWHRHKGCRYAYNPKSRLTFWRAKFLANESRDRKVLLEFRRLPWKALVIWECQLREPLRAERAITLAINCRSRIVRTAPS